MRFTLGDALSSSVAAVVFLVGIAVAGVAFPVADGSFGTPKGTPEWWLDAGIVAVAVLVTMGRWLSG